MRYKNYYVGEIYLFYSDLKGNSISKFIGKRIFRKRIDGTYRDINSKEKFYVIPKTQNVRGIFINKSSLTKLSDYIDMLYSEQIIKDKENIKLRELTII